MKKAMLFKATLVVAYDDEGVSIYPQSVNLFHAIHEPSIRAVELKSRIGKAFLEWTKTSDGQKYFETNGNNWGDATAIPTEFLAKHGIYSFENAERVSVANGEAVRRMDAAYHDKIIVDYNDPMFDESRMNEPSAGKDDNEVILPNRG